MDPRSSDSETRKEEGQAVKADTLPSYTHDESLGSRILTGRPRRGSVSLEGRAEAAAESNPSPQRLRGGREEEPVSATSPSIFGLASPRRRADSDPSSPLFHALHSPAGPSSRQRSSSLSSASSSVAGLQQVPSPQFSQRSLAAKNAAAAETEKLERIMTETMKQGVWEDKQESPGPMEVRAEAVAEEERMKAQELEPQTTFKSDVNLSASVHRGGVDSGFMWPKSRSMEGAAHPITTANARLTETTGVRSEGKKEHDAKEEGRMGHAKHDSGQGRKLGGDAPATVAHSTGDKTPQTPDVDREKVMSAVNHPTDAFGRSLNILEPLNDAIGPLVNRHVQSDGCLLVVTVKTGVVTHCSENILAMLEVEPAEVLTRPLQELFPHDALDLIRGAEHARLEAERRSAAMDDATEATGDKKWDGALVEENYYAEILNSMKLGDIPAIEIRGRHFMKKFNVKGKTCTVLANIPEHHSHSVIVDVFTFDEPAPDTRDLGIRLQELEADLSTSHNMYHGSQMLVERVNAVLGFDRAVVYRMWLPDNHAETIAEERRVQDLYPFLGLKFPPQSPAERQRYVDPRARIISDATSFPSTVIGSFDPNLQPITIRSPGGGITTVFQDRNGRRDTAAAVAAASPTGAASHRRVAGLATTEQHLEAVDPTIRPVSVPSNVADASVSAVDSPRTALQVVTESAASREAGQKEGHSEEPSASSVSLLAKSVVGAVSKVVSSVAGVGSGKPKTPSSPRSRTPAPSSDYDLNLSQSFLRSAAPCYLNLLRSLGIRGSMSVSIVVGRQLHGVLSFYSMHNHRRWCWENYQFLLAAECIFSKWLRVQEQHANMQQKAQLEEMGGRIRLSLTKKLEQESEGFIPLLMFGHPDLCEIAGADTFALVAGRDWLRVGALPPQTWLQQYATWVTTRADDQRRETAIKGWKAFKVWSTVNLGRDYPGPTPDPHLAAGSLCIVLKPEPLIALMMFRIENKSTEVWDGIDTAGAHSSKEAQPPGRASPSTSGVLTLAERTARNTRSVFAAQFLRAYRLSTHGSCAPWPINAHPLLQIITNVMIDHFEAHDSLKFFSANLQNLCQTVEPENTLPSRILREEMDGVLLLSRSSARSRPIAGLSDAMEERGGLGDAKPSDHVICVNQGWCEIFGFIDETADLRDKDIEKSLMTTGVPLEEIMHPLFDTSRTITVWSKKKGHTTLSFRCFHVFSVQHEEEFHEVLAFTFTDVTIQQRVEQALLLAHQQSRRSEQAKQSMIGMVSHELRTPLTAILGFSEILASDMRLSHEQREFVADIHSAGSHLLSIITNLLDLTKFELSDSKKTLVDIVLIVQEAALWLQKTLDAKMLTLHLRLPAPDGSVQTTHAFEEFTQLPGETFKPPSDPARSASASADKRLPLALQFKARPVAHLYTLGDAVSLKRVLINLLDNSSKFTPMLGSITVSVRALPPLVPSHLGVVEISVRDTGIGMTPAILGKIWEPFFQADLSAQRELGGAGLGLAMVKSIVELHDGTVSVESEVGAGSKFTINLPMANPNEKPPPTPPNPTEALLRFQAQHYSPSSARSLGSSPMLPTGETDLTLGHAGKGRYSRAMRTYVKSPSSQGLDLSSPSIPSPFGHEELSPQTMVENRARRAQAQEMERARLNQFGYFTPTSEPETRTPLTRALEKLPPEVYPRQRSDPQAGLAVPSLKFGDPSDQPDLEDDDDAFKAKLTQRYDTEDAGNPEMRPPVIPKVDVRGKSDAELEAAKFENQSRSALQTVPMRITQVASALSQSQVGSAITTAGAMPPAPAVTLPEQPALSKSTTAPRAIVRSHAPGKYDHIRLMVVDDSEINKKLFLRLLHMEGFTNVETAAHGLEAVEKLMIFREQSLSRWKKWMEVNRGDAACKQHFESYDDRPEEDVDQLRRRISSEAQVLTQALLVELGVAGSQYASLSEQERMALLTQAANQMVAREKMSLSEERMEPKTESQRLADRFAALNITPYGSPPPDPSEEKEETARSNQDAAAGSPLSTHSAGVVTESGRPLMSLSSPLSMLTVPCRLSPLLPKLIFLDLHMPLLDGFQTALAIRKLGFDMPIAALTASVGSADQRMAEQLGFQRYLMKPISRPQLKEVLQLAIKQAEPVPGNDDTQEEAAAQRAPVKPLSQPPAQPVSQSVASATSSQPVRASPPQPPQPPSAADASAPAAPIDPALPLTGVSPATAPTGSAPASSRQA